MSDEIEDNADFRQIIHETGGHCGALGTLYDSLYKNNHDNMQVILKDVGYILLLKSSKFRLYRT